MSKPRSFERIHYDLKTVGLPEVPLLGMYHNRSAHGFLGPHSHEGMLEICYLVSGVQVFAVRGKDYVMRPGDVFITFPDELHSSGKKPMGRGQLYWIQIAVTPANPRSFLGLDIEHSGELRRALTRMRRRFFRGTERIESLFAEIFSLLKDQPILYETRTAAIVTALLCEVLDGAKRTPPQAKTPSLNVVLAHIDEHMDHPLPPRELARVAKLSPSWFKARFKKEIGLPPGEYVHRRKVERARELLGRLSVSQVSLELGFSSPQYFATIFRRFTSMSPTEYMEKDLHKDRGQHCRPGP